MRHATTRLESARVILDQRAVHPVTIPLQIAGKIPERLLGVFLARPKGGLNRLSIRVQSVFHPWLKMSDTIKLKLTIAYDGTAYQGWQVQKTGTGVQQKVEEALAKIFPSVKRILSSSRTDTGVHALGMVADVDIPRTEFKMTLRKLPLAVNAWLPEDVRIVLAQRVPADFHARFQATGKQYRYFVWNHTAMNPLLRQQAWHVPVKLDVRAMRTAAKRFIGKHDFRSFAATHSYEIEDTVRRLTRCDIKRSGSLLTVIIEGDGFLYKMCRGIVGTLVQLGRGKFGEAELKRMLAAKDRRVAGMTAPAHGLVLWRVFYQPNRRSRREDALTDPSSRLKRKE